MIPELISKKIQMRDGIQIRFWSVVAFALVGLVACSDRTGEESSGTDAVNPAADAALTGTVSESGEAASPDSGEPVGDGTAERVGEEREHAGDTEHGRRERGEHGREEGHGELGPEGEEAGEYIRPGEAWDATRRGARLFLAFDPALQAFGGTVENTTRKTLCSVRVEVHLSTGTELGPTERTDLAPGESVAVQLPSGEEPFTAWTAHSEVSACNP